MTYRKYVLTHPEWGIYLGHALGLGFWTLLDVVGQEQACVFDTVEQARKHIASWDHQPKEPPVVRSVVVASAHWATVRELRAANLPEAWIAPMVARESAG
jgi:hypothetical protein